MESKAELLIELSTLDEAGAWVPNHKDQMAGVVPEWCELVLEAKRGGDHPVSIGLPLRRHDGELLIEVLHDALHPDAGGSVAAGLWADLDETVDSIQARIAKGKEPLKRDLGLALGLAIALARMTNPFEPDVDMVRAMAMERWEQRNG